MKLAQILSWQVHVGHCEMDRTAVLYKGDFKGCIISHNTQEFTSVY